MAMAAAGGAASATKLIAALNSAKTVKAVGGLQKSIEGINEAKGSGALDDIQQIFGNMTSSGPLLGIVKLIMAEFQSATLPLTMNIFKEVLELIQMPGVQDAFQAVKDILAFLSTNSLATTTAPLRLIISLISGDRDSLKSALSDLIEILINVMRTIKEVGEWFDETFGTGSTIAETYVAGERAAHENTLTNPYG